MDSNWIWVSSRSTGFETGPLFLTAGSAEILSFWFLLPLTNLKWVMKSLPFWIKNLLQTFHISYYYTVTYIIFKLHSNTFFIEFQTSILVITRTRSKCIHLVRGEFGDGHYSYEYFWASTRLYFENRVFFNE